MSTDLDVVIPGIKEAQQVVAWAEAARVAAFRAVDAAREDVALGRAPRGAIVKAQRALAEIDETRLTAEARIRGLRREAAENLALESEAREDARRALVATLVPQREALEHEAAEIALAFIRSLDDLAARLSEWSGRAQAAQPAYGQRTGVHPGSVEHLLNRDGNELLNAKNAARVLAQAATGGRR